MKFIIYKSLRDVKHVTPPQLKQRGENDTSCDSCCQLQRWKRALSFLITFCMFKKRSKNWKRNWGLYKFLFQIQEKIFGVPGPVFLHVMKQLVRNRGKGFAPTKIRFIVLERIIMVLKMKKCSVLMKSVTVVLQYLSFLIFFKFALIILPTLLKVFRKFQLMLWL